MFLLADAERLRSVILRALDAADRNSQNTPGGGLNFVVIGGAPTGVEMAGTLADMMKRTVPNEYRQVPYQVPYKDARIFLIEVTVGAGRVLSGFAALCSIGAYAI